MTNNQQQIMRNYLNYYNSTHFYDDLVQEFEQLKQFTNQIRINKTKTTKEGEKECNKKKNRYRDILPFDDTRVVLDSKQADNKCEITSDYINANFIKSSIDSFYKYIAAQGPTKETVLDFLRMFVQFNIQVVICACNEFEGQRLKCHRYWPEKHEQSYTFHDNYSTSLTSEPVEFDGCIIRHLRINYLNRRKSTSNYESSQKNVNRKSSLLFETNANELDGYEFTQYHLINWPDHGVPSDVQSLLKILSLVRKNMIENNRIYSENFMSLHHPHQANNLKFKRLLCNDYLAVHCSAGCGRTGTIIAIDQIWTLIKEKLLLPNFALYDVAKSLREQRIAMIQTFSQYEYFADSVAFLFERHLNIHGSSTPTSTITAPNSQPVNISTENLSPPCKMAPVQTLSNCSVPLQPDHSRIDSNNNLVNQHNYNKVKKMDPVPDLLDSTPAKSTQAESKSNRNSNHFSSVKQKINRFVPHMLSLFNNTPPSTIKTNNSESLIFSSAEALSSKSSPLSTTSDSSSHSVGTKKDQSITNRDDKTYVNSTKNEKSSQMKNSEKLTTDEIEIKLFSKFGQIRQKAQLSSQQNKESDFVIDPESSVNFDQQSKHQTTPVSSSKSCSKVPRKLFEMENLLQDAANNEAFMLNDKSMQRKEAGSVCEFLSNKLNGTSPENLRDQLTKHAPLSLNNDLFYFNSNKQIILPSEELKKQELEVNEFMGKIVDYREHVDRHEQIDNVLPKAPARTKIKKLSDSSPQLVISTLNNKETENQVLQPNEQSALDMQPVCEVKFRKSSKTALYRLDSNVSKNFYQENRLNQQDSLENDSNSQLDAEQADDPNSSQEIYRENIQNNCIKKSQRIYSSTNSVAGAALVSKIISNKKTLNNHNSGKSIDINETFKHQLTQQTQLNEPFRQYPHQRFSSAYNIRVNHLNKYLLRYHNARIRQSFRSKINANSNNFENKSKNTAIKLHLAPNSKQMNQVFNI